ncbi:hypothetical protein P7D22_19185 [Lichenihabitans sp. Uapishka_5]|nr:hypothetical protein [Lichenihabitans sp. Uapishka_5]MDX7953291.1 hypothetical protein [Lichenihabitans sp. Uapishka_5]
MSKNHQRSNKEKKKPKQEKPKEAAPALPFAKGGQATGSAKAK